MKTKKTLIKLIALFLCVILLLPVAFACGNKSPDNNAAKDGGTTADSVTEPSVTDAPTEPPTTTEPPPTEPPTTTEPYVVDESLSYWENIYKEMEHFGLKDGVKCLAGEDEAELMKKFSTGSTKKTELDVSGDNVPFTAAYSVVTAKDTDQFWNASYNATLLKDLPVEQDDLVVGVMWVRGLRLGETEKFMADEPATYYLALKTSTDNWATEGNVSPSREQYAGEGWQKIFFCGSVLNEEKKSSNLQLQIFLGYGNQQVDFGGIIAFIFPWTPENDLAAANLVDSTQ